MVDEIVKDICNELNISIGVADAGNLQNIFYKTIREVFENYFSHAQLHYLSGREGWNTFILPIDCVYILKVKPRVAYKTERNKFKTPGSDKIYIEYVSAHSDKMPQFKELITQRIKEYYKISEENS